MLHCNIVSLSKVAVHFIPFIIAARDVLLHINKTLKNPYIQGVSTGDRGAYIQPLFWYWGWPLPFLEAIPTSQLISPLTSLYAFLDPQEGVPLLDEVKDGNLSCTFSSSLTNSFIKPRTFTRIVCPIASTIPRGAARARKTFHPSQHLIFLFANNCGLSHQGNRGSQLTCHDDCALVILNCLITL